MAESLKPLGEFVQVKDIEPGSKDILVIFEVLMHLNQNQWFENIKAANSDKDADIWRLIQDVCIQQVTSQGFKMEKVEGTKYEQVQDIFFKILQNENKEAAPSPSGSSYLLLSLELRTALTKYLLN